jgi:hypothetical protein
MPKSWPSVATRATNDIRSAIKAVESIDIIIGAIISEVRINFVLITTKLCLKKER